MNTCKKLSLPIFIILLLTGCTIFSSDDGDSSDEISKALIGKTWELRSIQENGYGVYAPPIDSMYTITFTSDSTFSAYEICNVCSGDYQIESDELISFDGFICTEMACNNYPHSIPFSSLLGGNTFPISIQNDELHITVDEDDDTKQDYVFAEYSSTEKAIIADPATFDMDEWPSGSFNILESDLTANTLNLRVGYSGCGPHDLNLVFYNHFMESTPVQAYAIISHPEELCDAYFVTEESFDLNPLKEEYQKYYEEEGVIDISIFRQSTKEVSLRYEF